MLRKLTVSNLAVVERAEVEFGPGLNVLTGETGAGKSVLMGALELVLGGRAEASIVRDGAREAAVEAEFVECGKDEEVMTIRRTVTHEGRSRAWINDESVLLAELKALGERLVDIHGPRANQRLLEEDFQRDSLGVATKHYAEAWKTYRDLKAQVDELSGEEFSEDQLELLRYQVNELEEVGLSEDDETVGERHAAAAHREEIIVHANAITEALGGDRGAEAILCALQPKFCAIARHLPCAEDWVNRAEELTLGVQELSRMVVDAISRFGGGEESLAELDARLTVLNRLKRKYLRGFAAEKGEIAALLEVLETKRGKLDMLEHREERLADLQAKLVSARDAVGVAGAALTRHRRGVADRLAKAVTKELKDLGFARVRFYVEMEPIEATAQGCDRVVYMFEPNPGESARPLAAIASSGEIARVMLALKVVQSVNAKASCANRPFNATLVFDEIDANVGGEVGRVVGEKMRAVAKGRQVIAITHLPQSAAFGERHLVVTKSVSGGRTRTNISPVEGEARVSEIARMLGGENLTKVVREHAKELIGISR